MEVVSRAVSLFSRWRWPASLKPTASRRATTLTPRSVKLRSGVCRPRTTHFCNPSPDCRRSNGDSSPARTAGRWPKFRSTLPSPSPLIFGMVQSKIMTSPAARPSAPRCRERRDIPDEGPGPQPQSAGAGVSEADQSLGDSGGTDQGLRRQPQSDDGLRPHHQRRSARPLRTAPVLGPLDAYQWILLISAHSERHTKQIEEVKADPNFPEGLILRGLLARPVIQRIGCLRSSRLRSGSR
jgi:hypothetical protein